MAKKDDRSEADKARDEYKKLNDPVRKQDPYVNPVGNNPDGTNNESGCKDEAAKMVVVGALAFWCLKAMWRRRRG